MKSIRFLKPDPTPRTQAPKGTFFTRLCTPHNGLSNLSSLLYSKDVTDLYLWLSYVIQCLCRFSVVENGKIRDHLCYERMSLNTFKLYMSQLTLQVEINISEMLPRRLLLFLTGSQRWRCIRSECLRCLRPTTHSGFQLCYWLSLPNRMRRHRSWMNVPALWSSFLVFLVSAWIT